MELLTDGTENNPLLGFCLAVISRHAKKWPPTEQVLADEFVDWFGANSLMTPTAMRKLCGSKKINLSFVPRRQNFTALTVHFAIKTKSSFPNTKWPRSVHAYVISRLGKMLERAFVELGHIS